MLFRRDVALASLSHLLTQKLEPALYSCESALPGGWGCPSHYELMRFSFIHNPPDRSDQITPGLCRQVLAELRGDDWSAGGIKHSPCWYEVCLCAFCGASSPPLLITLPFSQWCHWASPSSSSSSAFTPCTNSFPSCLLTFSSRALLPSCLSSLYF